jgi:hypothetical protein
MMKEQIERMAESMLNCFLEDTTNPDTNELIDYAKTNYRANSPEDLYNAALERAIEMWEQHRTDNTIIR